MELFACVSGKVPTCHSDKHYFDYFDYILVRKPEYQIVLRCQYGSMDYYVHGGYACDWDDCKHETAKFILNGKEGEDGFFSSPQFLHAGDAFENKANIAFHFGM